MSSPTADEISTFGYLGAAAALAGLTETARNALFAKVGAQAADHPRDLGSVAIKTFDAAVAELQVDGEPASL
eukprot:7424564-Alexandrium_andersonii.AAC.1